MQRVLLPSGRALPSPGTHRSPCSRPRWLAGSAAARRGGRPAAASANSSATPQQQDAASLDVSGAVVQPAFRSTPWDPQAASAASAAGAADAARIALVSESGVCRCVLAAAALQQLLDQRGLAGRFQLECRSSRDYCVGEGPDPAAAEVAAELGWELPAGYQAQQFKEARDIVVFDLLLVVDKFVAADVLREVSVFDTIQTWGKANYSSKVRRLGEFASSAVAAGNSGGSLGSDPDAADIEDPLYGNLERNAELAAVRTAAAAIQQSCEGLVEFLAGVEQRHREAHQARSSSSSSDDDGGSDGGGSDGSAQPSLGSSLTAAVRELGEMDWLVPPMLAPR